MDKYRITVLKGHVFIIIVRTYPLPAVNKWIARVKREEEQRKFGELKEASSPRGRQCCFTSSWKLYRLVLGEVRFVSSSVCLAVCLSVFVEPPSHIQGHSHFHTTSHKKSVKQAEVLRRIRNSSNQWNQDSRLFKFPCNWFRIKNDYSIFLLYL